ncbi:MAG: hypothetical protein LBQ60_01365 [Bacteroidales bacterium]|jgi:hypothetical protein|nr:hypothetical protein [Bacteroidales bacterium]
MDHKERIDLCKTCRNGEPDKKEGIVCFLTGNIPDFEEHCPAYIQSHEIIDPEEEIIDIARRRTLRVFYTLIGISFITVLFLRPYPLGGFLKGFMADMIRIMLEIIFYYLIFKGKEWAKLLMTVLWGLCVAACLVLMIFYAPLLQAGGVIPMILIYTVIYAFAIYYCNYNKSFLSFFRSQKNKFNHPK